MQVPLVDLTSSEKDSRFLLNKIVPLFRKGTFILGKEVEVFEKAFASYIGTAYCIGVASGTDAILLSLRALGVGEGDEVIVPAMTFIATGSAVLYSGAKPVFVDISPNQPTIDVSQIEKAITKKTKAIIPVHLQGMPANMAEIMKIAKKHHLFVIEDACQAHGSKIEKYHEYHKYHGYHEEKSQTSTNKARATRGTLATRATSMSMVGSIGHLGAFSFYPSKNLGAVGDAGAIVTSDKKLAERLYMMRHHGQKIKDVHSLFGYNSRLDAIQAVVLKEKLKTLDKNNSLRRLHAKKYTSLLRDLPMRLPQDIPGTTSNYYIYSIQVKKRDALQKFLAKKGIGTGIHYPTPMHLHLAWKHLGYAKGDFPHAERFADENLSIPMYPGLTDKQIEYVVGEIRRFFKKG